MTAVHHTECDFIDRLAIIITPHDSFYSIPLITKPILFYNLYIFLLLPYTFMLHPLRLDSNKEINFYWLFQLWLFFFTLLKLQRNYLNTFHFIYHSSLSISLNTVSILFLRTMFWKKDRHGIMFIWLQYIHSEIHNSLNLLLQLQIGFTHIGKRYMCSIIHSAQLKNSNLNRAFWRLPLPFYFLLNPKYHLFLYFTCSTFLSKGI